jgi:CspA family cold shock protein
MQGVVRSFDPIRAEGIVVSDQDRKEFIFASDALEGSVFRNLRQGQRINFELDGDGNVTKIRIGSEADMGMPSVEI